MRIIRRKVEEKYALDPGTLDAKELRTSLKMAVKVLPIMHTVYTVA